MTDLKDFRRYVFFVGLLVFASGMYKLAIMNPQVIQRILIDFPSVRFFVLMFVQLCVLVALRWACYKAAELIWRWKGLQK
jgi:hypothetical protein